MNIPEENNSSSDDESTENKITSPTNLRKSIELSLIYEKPINNNEEKESLNQESSMENPLK